MDRERQIHLNDLQGFQWVSAGNNNDNFGKACINHESFWLKDCVEGANGVWTGYVDNQPFGCELNIGDKVTFVICI